MTIVAKGWTFKLTAYGWPKNHIVTVYVYEFVLSGCGQGQKQAELFVQDFIITQLIGKDILELCAISNPMGLLIDVLQQLGELEPEPR